MLTLDEDRRSHERVALERPCKIFDPRSGKYCPGRTCDVSAGGMLVALERNCQFKPGDEVYVGIAQKRRQMLLRTNDMLRVRVARCLGAPSGTSLVGLELLDAVPVDLTPTRRAA